MLPRSLQRRLAAQDGFSIVEVLVAAVVLVVGLLGTLTLVDTATTATFQTKSREQATALQRELIEAVRAVPYDQLTPASLAGAVQDRDALADSGSSPGWSIHRRDTTYTVAVSSCVVDDPRDGRGTAEADVFCEPTTAARPASGCQALLDGTPSATAPAKVAGASGSSAQRGACGIDADLDGIVDGLTVSTTTPCAACSPLDTAPADYKRVTSLVRWEAGEVRRSVLMVTTIPNPGLSAAPAVTYLERDPSGDAPVTAAVTSLNFRARATPSPASLLWYRDGATQGGATSAGADWTFRWDFGSVSLATGAQPAPGELLDGSYVIAAKAFDKYGQYGASRSKTVLINRRRPFAPLGLLAGRNLGAIELEWRPNHERDIEGYRVYRLTPGGPVLACETVERVGCLDVAAPPTGDVSYAMVALDKDGTTVREGDLSATAVASGTNRPPFAPPTLQATTSGGDVVLAWTKPDPGDPDPGDRISHFNIYRDSVLYADRYDRTGNGDQVTYVDTRAGGEPHTYWVTAVDTHLAESQRVGAVAAGG